MSEEGKENIEPKETSEGLPVVTEITIKSVESQYTSGGETWGQHLERVKARLIAENPRLVDFINKQVGKYPPQLHKPMFEVIVGTIAVLEHQASANKISSIFGKDNPPSSSEAK